MEKWNTNKGVFRNLKEAFLDFGVSLLERGDEELISGEVKFSDNADSIDWNFLGMLKTLVSH